ncbi:MAG TPA: 1,4-alpha-glucan branching protein GlgB, partial [Candidatus Merdenecus merdavium]|nr:1,4-alpha-glucan branching protein GlgB [Candidatus Merdenecus merdavium]
EEDRPGDILGAHLTKEGVLIQVYDPTACSIKVKINKVKTLYPMEKVDEDGFFAVLLSRKQIPSYELIIEKEDGKIIERKDIYNYPSQFTEKDLKKFEAGIHYDIYEKLGAHPMTIKGVEGVLFAVWAPNALRVSVVGDFNHWDGRIHQMNRLGDYGIFELFIPGVQVGELYKFEIKAKCGLVFLKSDPYGNAAQMRPETASIVTALEYQWKDHKWLSYRKKVNTYQQPMSIYELHLGSFRKPEDREFYNYRELAPLVAEYVMDMHYTHVELMPIMEHPYDKSWGYQVTGYYAPTSRYGSPQDFMYFIDYLHSKNIGIILDWVPAHFPRDTFGLSNFDGTCLYEHKDPRQGSHPDWGTLIYNYGRPQVTNFLIANALFWVNKYHIDGIRIDAVASMLYLDYGRKSGEWIPNMYGENENLEAIEFLKHLNSIFHKEKTGSVLIAEDSTAWPMVTGELKENGLGFDYKWNMGWMNDFLGYMKYDPIERSYHHGELIFSMIYAYSERFILCLSHDEVVHGKSSMIGKMPGDGKIKFSNLRAAYGYMMAHPGKKLLFMGQDFGQYSEWSEDKELEWSLLEYEEHKQLQDYMRDLNKLYKNQPALYKMDYDEKGFEWINNISANENIVVFLRKTNRKDETLLIISNFSGVDYENYKIGVPYQGKYKEIFNSDQKIYGGNGFVNPRIKMAKKSECDARDYSILIKVAALSTAVFSYVPTNLKSTTNKTALKAKMEEKTKEKKEEKTKPINK